MEQEPQVSAPLPLSLLPPLELALHVPDLPLPMSPHQTAPSTPTTALKLSEPPETTALLLLAPPLDATQNKLATPTTLELASPYHALQLPPAPPGFALSLLVKLLESVLNVTKSLAQEMNALLPPTMIQLLLALPVFAS